MVREGCLFKNGWIFRKIPRGEGHFLPKNSVANLLAFETTICWGRHFRSKKFLWKNCNIFFPLTLGFDNREGAILDTQPWPTISTVTKYCMTRATWSLIISNNYDYKLLVSLSELSHFTLGLKDFYDWAFMAPYMFFGPNVICETRANWA